MYDNNIKPTDQEMPIILSKLYYLRLAVDVWLIVSN
jgi:hypothetical protein